MSYHGLALNVDVDLAPYGRIVPCGIAVRSVTSVAALMAGGPESPATRQKLEEAAGGLVVRPPSTGGAASDGQPAVAGGGSGGSPPAGVEFDPFAPTRDGTALAPLPEMVPLASVRRGRGERGLPTHTPLWRPSSSGLTSHGMLA